MATTLLGRIGWGMTRDSEGHRDYTIKWKIESAVHDGPERVLFTPGLPSIGSTWSFGNDADVWAFCLPTTSITPILEGEPNTFWTLTQTFSTRPLYRCQTQNIENPLMEPPRISGSFVKFVKEVAKDRHGNLILNAAHQPITGTEVQFDDNRPTVSIEVTSLTNNLATFASMVDNVNDANLWGLSPRKIKMSNASWERRMYGTCTFYYVNRYEFEIDFNTFDRKLANKGTMHIDPQLQEQVDVTNLSLWDPSTIDQQSGIGLPWRDNPRNFVVIKDDKDENTGTRILDEFGRIWDGKGTPPEIAVEHYPEANFLLLGVPTTL